MTWHAEPVVLEAYARGTVADSMAYSVESHLLSCETCRDGIAGFADRPMLDRVWVEVDDVVALPMPGPIERLLLRLGVSDHVARLLAATPSLRVSWLSAVALALVFAVAAAHFNEQGFLLFVVVAPMLPLAGVAVAYGPGVDPTYEIGVASPVRGFHLLSIRAIAVLVSTTLLAGVAALMLPQVNWAAAAWLLPSLALTTASLALSTTFRPIGTAAGVAVAWVGASVLGMLFAAQTSADLQEVFGQSMQLVVLVVTLASTTLLVRRREALERGASR